MRILTFITISLLVFFFSCGRGVEADRFMQDDDMIRRGLDTITVGDLKENLAYLCSDALEGRRTGSAGEAKASAFLAEKLTGYGVLAGGTAGYLQKFSSGNNVIGYFEGSDLKDEVVVVGAHYDHLGKGYPGADDNGSGTVAVLEVAEALSRVKLVLRRSVVVGLWSGEEQGMVGSSYYVDHPKFPINKTIYSVNLDMIGYLRDGDLSFLGGGSSSYVKTLIQTIAKNYPSISPSITSSAGGGSDHVPFRSAGVGVTFLHTGTTSVYHTSRDTPDKVNYDGMSDVAKIAFEMTYYLATNDSKPKAESPYVMTTGRDHDIAEFQQ